MRKFSIDSVKVRILLAFCVSAIFSCAYSQVTIPMPKLETNLNGKKELLQLSALNINVSIVGNLATTTLDMTFMNHSSRVLEGELEFPLGEGQTISRYALDFNGKLREGVVVEKEKGRQVFESIVRRGVDPGLAEMTRGNNFKTRVYPIPSQGTRRVLIAYEQELKNIEGKKHYSIPLQFNQVIGQFSIQVQVFKQTVKPKMEENPFNHFKFESWNEGYQASFTANNYSPEKILSFQIPDVPGKENVFTEDEGSTTYFYLPTSIPIETRPKKMPKSLTLIYDVSGSSGKNDKSKELALLRAYFEKLGNVPVQLIEFSSRISTGTTIVADKSRDVLDIIQHLGYDGGTQLGCLDFTKYKSDEIILFTDGISNFGKSHPVNSTTPLIIINSNPIADHSYLRSLAQMNFGNYINLCALTLDEAEKILTSNPYRFIGSEYDKTAITEVYPYPNMVVNESFSIAGMLKTKEASITLHFGFGNETTKSITYKLSTPENNRSVNMKRIWAQKKLAELDVEYEKNKDAITTLAKKYSIVTRNTSLIVLDRVEDYVQYEITPPAELLEEYNQLVSRKPKPPIIDLDTMLVPSSVITQFEEFHNWWKSEFKPKPVVVKRDSVIPRSRSNRRVNRNSVRFTPPNVTNEEEVRTSDALMIVDANSVEVADLKVVEESSSLQELSFSTSILSKQPKTKSPSISLQPWSPDTFLVGVLNLVGVEPYQKYYQYQKLRKNNENSMSFYMDAADCFIREGYFSMAERILSNLAEFKLEDAEIMRTLGRKLVEMKYYKEAIDVFNEVLKMRREEPQSYRDLAMAYSLAGNTQKAVELLYKVARTSWDSRFEGIQQIALNEMNALIALNPKNLDLSMIDKRLIVNNPVDIRIVLTWNTNDCDIDLWVTDPRGEKCDYSHNRTEIGGRMSRDITQGYGPEEFCLKNALIGDYKVQVNYYGTNSQKLLQPVIVQVEVFTNFGRPNQKRQIMILRLANVKNTFDIGTVKFEK